MTMDQSWITAPRMREAYEKGVEEFLAFAIQNAPEAGAKYFCPCVKCVNGRRQSLNDIRSHLICDGFCPTYTKRIWHSESLHGHTTTSQPETVYVQSRD